MALLAGLGLAVWLSACTATPAPLTPGDWLPADLLALDPPEASLPGADLLALYTRSAEHTLHLRLDLLDFSGGQSADLYIALDTTPGGATSLSLPGGAGLDEETAHTWDALLVIPASGALQVLDADLQALPASALRVARSPASHSVSISLNSANLPGAPSALRLEAFSALPGTREALDRLGPVGPQSPAPQALPTLLAFWDTFPASTAIQALRRWDGAHTGPLGGRHGLYNLLRTARAHGMPLVLLDLSSPEALSALDYAGGRELLVELARDSGLALPAALPGLLAHAGTELPLVDATTLSAWLEHSRQSQLAFGLPASPFVYAPLSAAQFPALSEALRGQGRTLFTLKETSDSSFGQAALWGVHSLLSLPRTPAGLESDRQDIALEARRTLAQAAWDWNQSAAKPSSFLVLGGSLPESPFGSPQYARLAFTYLKQHAWIKLLTPHDLQTLPGAADGLRASETSPETSSTPDPRLAAVPAHPSGAQTSLQALAANALRAIYTQPYPSPPELPALRSGYLGLVSSLGALAAWTENPRPRLDCTADPDQDGAPECVLASESFYAVIEPGDGRLALAAALRQGEAHLLVAPGYLLASGLSDPATWDLSAGESADPQVLAGGLGDPGGPGGESLPYQVRLLTNGVRLTSADGASSIQYNLAGAGLAFSYHGPERSLHLPLVVDPGRRFTPGWWEGFDFAWDGNTLSWTSGAQAFALESSQPGELLSFREGEAMLGAAENPERELPAGMFLPLPMAVVEWQAAELEGWLR